jgi:hypothetical protein
MVILSCLIIQLLNGVQSKTQLYTAYKKQMQNTNIKKVAIRIMCTHTSSKCNEKKAEFVMLISRKKCYYR